MRSDMGKVVTDLARGGSSQMRNHSSRLKIRTVGISSLSEEMLDEYDSGPGKFSMAPRNKYNNRYDEKSGGIRFAPLRRFLRSRVGKPWNSVYSELCRQFDTRSNKGRMIMQDVLYMVNTDCQMREDGKIYTHGRFLPWFEVRGLYVHPTTGILCYKQEKRYRPDEKYHFMDKLRKFGFSEFIGDTRKTDKWQNFRIISDLEVLEKKNGSWFIHTFDHYKVGDVVGTRFDLATMTTRVIYYNPKNPSIHEVSCRQLGKKELKKFREVIAGNPF